MSNWKTYSLSEVVDKRRGISYGIVQPGIFVEDGIPIIKVNNLTDRKLSYADVQKVKPEVEAKHQRTKLRGNEILLSLVGTLGHIAKVSEEMIGWNVARAVGVLPIADSFDKEWIYWFLKSPQAQNFVHGQATTSVQATLNLKELQELQIAYPDEEYRKKATEVLSALDDKIELNRRMNQTLEQMAQTLFRQYFVDGIDEENLPEGWREGKLGDIYKTTSGGTPSRKKPEYYGDDIPWIKSKELNGSFILSTEEKITQEGLKKSSAKLLPPHSVLVAMYGATVGQLGISSIKATCNQAICAILPNTDYPYTFIFQFLSESKEELINRATGSAQQNISQVLIQNFELVVPPVEVVKQYHHTSIDLFNKIEANLKEITTLTKLRDTLLPKLMSGEIDVMKLKTDEQHEPILS